MKQIHPHAHHTANIKLVMTPKNMAHHNELKPHNIEAELESESVNDDELE